MTYGTSCLPPGSAYSPLGVRRARTPGPGPRGPDGVGLVHSSGTGVLCYLFRFVCLFVFVFNSLGESYVHLEVTTTETKDGAHGVLGLYFLPNFNVY